MVTVKNTLAWDTHLPMAEVSYMEFMWQVQTAKQVAPRYYLFSILFIPTRIALHASSCKPVNVQHTETSLAKGCLETSTTSNTDFFLPPRTKHLQILHCVLCRGSVQYIQHIQNSFLYIIPIDIRPIEQGATIFTNI